MYLMEDNPGTVLPGISYICLLHRGTESRKRGGNPLLSRICDGNESQNKPLFFMNGKAGK